MCEKTFNLNKKVADNMN